LDQVPYHDEIFKNVQKGERANKEELKAAFNSDEFLECFQVIVEKGEIQTTSDERKEKIDKKKREIVNYIHKYYVDPKNNTPHPVTRIELALEELKVKVDPEASTSKQVQDVIKRLPEIMAIKKVEMVGNLFVPHKFLGQAQGIIHKYGTVSRENYTNEGCEMEISFVPGDYDVLMSDLNKITSGSFTFDLPADHTAATTDAEGKGKNKKGGGKGKAKK